MSFDGLSFLSSSLISSNELITTIQSLLIILITLSFLSKRSELIFGEILIFLRLLIEYCVSILNSLILSILSSSNCILIGFSFE